MSEAVHRLLTADDLPDASTMGGKGAALADLTQAGFNVPAFVIVPPVACGIAGGGAIGDATLEPRWCDLLIDALERLASPQPANREETRWAVRSSALDEDGAQHAFAGQFDSFLHVPTAAVADHVAAVWRSTDGERLRAYRREHGLSEQPTAAAVVVQRMIDPEAAGVAFSADPVSGRFGLRVVSGVRGVGQRLVSGDADACTWWIDRHGRIERREVPKSDPDPPVSDELATEVAALAHRCAEHFARPQDIEWAVTDGVVHLLQSRPITSLAGRADPDAPTRLFDNSNIAESYSGVTSAMTFSFARFAYEHVYREFCRLMRVPAATIETQNHVFTHLLARVRGRVYYNLINWYRVLTLLPGFRANRAFMEQMMGVSEDLPEEIAESLAHTTWSQRMSDRLGLLGSSAALLVHHLRLPRTIKRFQRRLDATLVEPDPPLSARRLDELADDYRRLETALLKRWDAPLINDFLAMIFFGVLGKLTRTWCGDEHGTLQNDLLVGEGGIVSSEPARRVVHMARLAAGNDELIHALQHEPWRRAMRHLGDHSQLAGEIDDYLARFGDRCLEELKLESPTLSDDPTALLRSIGAVAATQRSSTEDSGRDVGTSTRAAAETRVAHALHRRPLRSIVFAWVLRNARHRVRDRENLRFERTRVFGRVRRLILHMGRHLHVHGKLDDPRDVFHLELHELLRFITGDAACDDLAGVVAVRRAEDERYRGESPPPRFTTQGPPGLLTDLLASRSEATTEAAFDANSELRGIGCCPGVVRGRARVIRDPRGVALQPGDILVAERTDPGWVLLFPAAAGVVVERGSLLSHSAIVARELGLPAVVSVPGLMTTLRDGETIELDGSRGTVRRMDATEESVA